MLGWNRCQMFEDRINLIHKVSETLLGNIVDRPIRPAAGISHRRLCKDLATTHWSVAKSYTYHYINKRQISLPISFTINYLLVGSSLPSVLIPFVKYLGID